MMRDKEFFPLTYISNLKEYDPELAEILGNFILQDVSLQVNLDLDIRMMVMLASLIAQQAVSQYEIMLHDALDSGLTPVKAKEVVYQVIPYCGLAKGAKFVDVTNEVIRERGVKLPLPVQSTTTEESRYSKGLMIQKYIFGAQIDEMQKTTPDDQKHIQRCLSENCFGDYYTRMGLDVRQRELLVFTVLSSLGGCEPQLISHIRGNINVGNDRETLISVLTQILPYIGYPRMLNAIRCVNEVTS